MFIKESIGDRVKRLRESKGMAQAELARLLKVSPQMVHKVESNHTKTMRLPTAIKFAKALNVSADYILEGDESNVPAFDGEVLKFLSNPSNRQEIITWVRKTLYERELAKMNNENRDKK